MEVKEIILQHEAVAQTRKVKAYLTFHDKKYPNKSSSRLLKQSGEKTKWKFFTPKHTQTKKCWFPERNHNGN